MSIGKSSIARAAGSVTSAHSTPTAKPKMPTSTLIPVELKSIKYLTPQAADRGTAPADLVASIRKAGVISPLLIARTQKNDLYLLDGHLRVAAAVELKTEQLSAVVIPVENKKAASAIFKELNAVSPKHDVIREAKFEAISLTKEMPYYLL
ncbi:MAG: ParB N-terminal domain-containing protein [Clostridia bacterium]|nr:ParB N-terminal domain-containing protein [Clostridia bacterium]